MADTFTPNKRSQIMAAVHSTNNKLTEGKLVKLFRESRITGWRRHLSLPGKPDFTFRKQRVVVFVDGCFWHGCKKHLRMPETNRDYWQKKISRNTIRDRIATKELRELGWKVLRVWEHELRGEPRFLKRILRALCEEQK
jgi:DNA mismatch endonuclease (patch repair protein)